MQQGIHEKVSQVIDADKLKQILEAALLAADEPLTVDQFVKLFREGEVEPETIRADIREALAELETQTADRGYELIRVASGYRYQVRQELSAWVSRLWEEKPPRYSRALLETLALVAYKQPVTRGDIEEVRGVSVSQSIMRTLVERGWIRVVGQREVPGHPAMYGTTRAFLDYFNLKSLDQLPPLPEIRELIEPVIVAENLEADAARTDNPMQLAADQPTDLDAAELEETAADVDAADTVTDHSAASYDSASDDSAAASYDSAADDHITALESTIIVGTAETTDAEDTSEAQDADVDTDDEVKESEAAETTVAQATAKDATEPTEATPAAEVREIAEVVQLPSAKR